MKHSGKYPYRFTFAVAVFAALLLTALFLPAISNAANGQDEVPAKNNSELENVGLQLKWLHQFQFAGYYAAEEISKKQKERQKQEAVAFGSILLLMLLFFAWNVSLEFKVGKGTKALSDETERLDKVRKALLESERKFHGAFMSSPAVLTLSTAEGGRFVDVNRAFCEVTGYRREEAVGRRSGDLKLWRDPSQRARMIEETKNATFGKSVEIEIAAKNGEIKTGLFACGKIEISGKEYLLSHFVDLTEQKKTEEALRKNERRYRIVADFSFDWEYWIGPDGKFKYISPSCITATGYSPDEFASNPGLLNAIVHEDDKEVFSERTGYIDWKTTTADILDFRIVARDGSAKWINHNSRPVFSGDGAYLGQRVSNRDITERKLAEQALRKSEARFRAITEKNEDVTVILDKEGKVKYVSPSVAPALRFAPDEIVGKEFRFFLREDHRRVAKEIFERAAQKPDAPLPLVELAAVRKDGRSLFFEGLVTNMLDDPGIEGIVINCRDVSARKKMEEELGQARKLEAIGRLAGEIAHDFNNILSSLMGYADLAVEDVNTGNSPEKNLTEVINAGVRASDLVKQVFAFSRPPEENSGFVKIGAVAEETTELLLSALPSSIRVEKKIEGSLSVQGDPSQFHQVFMNLFTNAAQAMEARGGVLEVRVEDVDIDPKSLEFENNLKPGPHVKATVSDTGAGIAPDILGSIFQPFFTTKREGEGTGMGLAVVREIVRKYKGHVSVESEQGNKTVFTVFFPGVPEQEAACEKAEEEIAFGREHILFIDDDVNIAETTGELLRRMGYRVTVVADSGEALALFRSAPDKFDLVVTDLIMPNMSGEKLAVSMMETRPDIPVVLFTGYQKRKAEDLALEKGVKAILRKPVVKKTLAKTIRNILDARKNDDTVPNLRR